MRGRTRLSLLGTLLASLLAGCTSGPPEGNPARSEEPDPQPVVVATSLSDDMLCWEVNDAIRRITEELMAAPNTDADLIAQTVVSYRAYAARLRELAGLAESDLSERGIIDAAEAAEAYAQKVFDQDSYRVDITGVIEASRRAFPTCDLAE